MPSAAFVFGRRLSGGDVFAFEARVVIVSPLALLKGNLRVKLSGSAIVGALVWLLPSGREMGSRGAWQGALHLDTHDSEPHTD